MSSENTSSFSGLGSANAGNESSSSVSACTEATSAALSDTRKFSATPSSVGSPHTGVCLSPLQRDELRDRLAAPDPTSQECNTCHQWWPLTSFVLLADRNKGRTFRNPRCNRCRVAVERATPRMQRRIALIESAKAQPCTDCHNRFPEECMDFDHVRGEKKFAVSARWRAVSYEELVEELSKCEVVCSNCHRTRTRRRCYPGHGQPRKTASLAEIPRGGAKFEPSTDSSRAQSTEAT